MGRGKHKDHSHSAKRAAYNERRKRVNYPKGGYGKGREPYKSIIVSGAALFFVFAFGIVHADSDIVTTATDVAVSGFGLTGGNPQRYEQSFVATQGGTIGSVDIGVSSINGASTDNVKVSIQADSGGSPSGTELSSGVVSGTTLTVSTTVCTPIPTITMDAPVPITNGTTYWLVVTRTGSLAGYPNGYNFCGDGSSTYGAMYVDYGSGFSSVAATAEAVIHQTDGGGGATTTATTTTSALAVNRDEALFVFGLFAFLLGVPFWDRVFTIGRNSYVA